MIDEARALLAEQAPGAVDYALAYVDRAFEPVPVEPSARQGWKIAMDERLRRLAVKISPTMSPAQSQPWREVMVDALSDLPAMVALTAAKRAVHHPLKYMNEVEGVVREIARHVSAERRLARSRLENLRLAPQSVVALPPQEDGAPISFDEIRKMSPTIRDLGISSGFITPDQLAQVEAVERTEAA